MGTATARRNGRKGASSASGAAAAALVLLGIFGVALFFGDATITPAISVIASVEGLGSAQPGLKSFVLPVTLTLLTVLFAGQRFGTHALGRLFGVIVSVETATFPHVGRSEQIVVDDLGYEDDGIVYLTVRYGFQDDQNVPAALRQAAAEGLPVEIDVETATYFVSEITIVLGDDPGMRTWRKRLFLLLSRTSKSPVDFFGLPQRRIVTMGSYIEL